MFESLDYVAVNFEIENKKFSKFHILWNGGFKLKLDQYRLYLSFNKKVNCYYIWQWEKQGDKKFVCELKFSWSSWLSSLIEVGL